MHLYSREDVYTIRAVLDDVEERDAEQLPTPALDRVPPTAELAAMLDQVLAAQAAMLGGAPCAR